MIVTNISDFRKDIKNYLEKISKNFETIIINKGKDASYVLISLEEYNALKSTNYELSSRINELRLDSAIEKLSKKQSFEKELIIE